MTENKHPQIKPLENLSLVDKVEARLYEFFKESNFKIGDTIPKETELATSLGVSRTAVREALLRMRTLGLVTSKRRKGTVLAQPDVINSFERIMDPKILTQDTLKDMFEFRLTLEMGMADLLFERITVEDFEELEKIVIKAEQSKIDTTFYSPNDEITFHGKLYQISKNKTLERFQNILLPVFEFVHKNNSSNNTPIHSSNRITHRNLLDHLKIGTPETFRMAMRKHLDLHFDWAFETLKNQ